MPSARPSTLSILAPTEDFPRQLLGYKTLRGGREVAVVVDAEGTTTIARITTTGRGKNRTSSATLEVIDAEGARTQSGAVAVRVAETAIREAKKNKGKKGVVSRKGTWTGKMYVDPETLNVELVLTRKVASYSTLEVKRLERGTWWWTFKRSQKWFTHDATTRDSKHHATLAAAVHAGYLGMLGAVGQACGVRDTTRRQAFDPTYAAKFPLKPARQRKDRTAVFLEKTRRPTAPRTKAAQKKMAASVVTDAIEARTALEQPASAAHLDIATVESHIDGLLSNWAAKTLRDTSAPFTPTQLHLLPVLADQVRRYLAGREKPADKTVALSAFGKTIRSKINAVYKGRANAALRKAIVADWEALAVFLRSPPAIFARAQNLLKFAAATVASKKCTGAEKTEAQKQLDLARTHLAQATLQINGGGMTTASITELKRGLEKVALAATRAGKRCGLGQTALLSASQLNTPPLLDGAPGLSALPKDSWRPPHNEPPRPKPPITVELKLAKGTGLKKAAIVEKGRALLHHELKKVTPTIEITGGGRGSYTLSGTVGPGTPKTKASAALKAAQQALDAWIEQQAATKATPAKAPTKKTPAKKTPAKKSGGQKKSATTAEKDAVMMSLMTNAIGDLVRELQTSQQAA